MKILLTLTLLFSLNAFAEELDENCDYPIMEPILEVGNAKMISEVSDAIKNEFKRRPTNLGLLAISIESNFSVPVIGNGNYFGRIYMRPGETKIRYRDELIADDHYKDEKAKPNNPYFSTYNVSDINSANGLSLVKAAGANVSIKSDGKFSSSTGGRVYLKVKAPGEDATSYTIDVTVVGGKVQNFIHHQGKRIAFDSLKINADKNFLGSTTILAGIKNIQFSNKGKVVATANQ